MTTAVYWTDITSIYNDYGSLLDRHHQYLSPDWQKKVLKVSLWANHFFFF